MLWRSMYDFRRVAITDLHCDPDVATDAVPDTQGVPARGLHL